MKVARASSGRAATERSRGRGWRLVELIGHLRYFVAGPGAKNSAHCTHRVSILQWLGSAGVARVTTYVNIALLGDATPSQPPLPRPAPPRLPPALGVPVRLAHGEPDAGRGSQLAHLRADRV